MDVLFEVMAKQYFWTLAFGVAVVAIIFGTVKQIWVSMVRERTRRDIAAYIAEGTMTPEQGERLLKAAPKNDSDCC